MADRFTLWLSTGVLAAGVTAGTITGTGFAVADDGTTDNGGNTSSESSDSSDPPNADDTQDNSDVDNESDEPGGKTGDDVEDPGGNADKEAGELDEKDSDEPPPSPDRGKDSGRERVENEQDDITQSEHATAVVDEQEAIESDADANVEPKPAPEPVEIDNAVEATPPSETETPLHQSSISSEPSTPNVVETISAAVTSTVTSLLNPFAADNGAPLDPAAQTPMWTLAAAARREFENAFQSPTLTEPVDAQTTSEAALVAVEEGTLTYTAPPSFGDAVASVVVVGRGLVHGWPISGLPLYSATAAVRPDIYEQLDVTGEETLAAAVTPQAAQPSLINVIGTFAWNVLDTVTKLVIGEPSVPPGSTVTAGQSTLEIDCGDGYLADADWYYPKTGQPDKFIYFQHGFLARASVYNLTLTELAERNNAIVVAPSITSNYFACDGCSLTADPMHAAVARLFAGDRAALLASARAAGFEGQLPTEFVFAGQSAGAMLAAGASGYFYASAPATKKSDMVGVLLFDGSAANGALARALDKLPASVPVLHIAGTPTVINNGGDANQVLLAKRPGQFNGVQLVGGSHSDAFQSSAYNGLVQAFVGLTFGQSKPENVEAVQILSQGWITDMYARRVYDPARRTGVYGTPGQPGQTVVDIATDAGPARGYVLPGPPPALSPIERFFAGLLQSINSNDFATCATDVARRSACAS